PPVRDTLSIRKARICAASLSRSGTDAFFKSAGDSDCRSNEVVVPVGGVINGGTSECARNGGKAGGIYTGKAPTIRVAGRASADRYVLVQPDDTVFRN